MQLDLSSPAPTRLCPHGHAAPPCCQQHLQHPGFSWAGSVGGCAVYRDPQPGSASTLARSPHCPLPLSPASAVRMPQAVNRQSLTKPHGRALGARVTEAGKSVSMGVSDTAENAARLRDAGERVVAAASGK
jgi:hypothetical protein